MRPAFRMACFLLSIALWTPSTHAETLPLAAGSPKIAAHLSVEYFLWRDADGIHLRWTGDGRKHAFAGAVKADGYITRLVGVGMKNATGVSRKGPNVFTYAAVSDGASSGVDFHLIHSKEVSFELLIDKTRASPKSILLGSDMRHPSANPFNILLP